MMEYTYTGNAFDTYTDPPPPSPPAGDAVTIRFIYDGSHPTGSMIIQDFSMSCGNLQLSAPTPGWVSYGRIEIAEGLPILWEFVIMQPFAPAWLIYSSTINSTFGVADLISHSYIKQPPLIGIGQAEAYNVDNP